MYAYIRLTAQANSSLTVLAEPNVLIITIRHDTVQYLLKDYILHCVWMNRIEYGTRLKEVRLAKTIKEKNNYSKTVRVLKVV